jgi:Secretion system C-terminal sorting domain
MRLFTLLLLLTLSGTVAMSQDRVPQQGVPVQAVRMIRFYPNPATTFINIEPQKAMARGYSFQVYNFLGKKVADLQEVTSRTRIDLTNFSRGIYIYQLKDATGKVVESGKFQVEK